ncbi:MAG: Uma2 family endonuclease [Firmicutes bacterium]|nr:Uma2 family endonuclease [Bacillota bacterium]
MQKYLDMAVYPRHSELLERIGDMLFSKHSNEILNKQITKFRENNALIFRGKYGCIGNIPPFELFNVNETELSFDILNDSPYVQPDYMIFHHNKHQQHSGTYKIAGCPDLIIEVWSKSNSAEDRKILNYLYSTSEITEFWQLEQQSNEVHCSIGTNALPMQSLRQPLRTQSGLEIDLRSVAL